MKHNEIDKNKWNTCIKFSFNGIVYAYSWYLDLVSPGWEALVEDDYVCVMPLTCRRKFFINYLFQPFFTQQLGVFSVHKLNESKLLEFVKCIPAKYKLIEINLNTFNKIGPSDFEVKNNLTHELDLIESYEDHFSRYAENTRRNVKKALKNDLKIVGNISPERIISLFQQHRGKDLETYKAKDYKTLSTLVRRCVKKGKGQIWAVQTKDGKLCAGAFFVESNGKVIFLFSGSNELAKKNGAMFYLIDRFIFQNAQRNLVLDFEGSNDPNLARFYKGFGSKECVYLHIRKNNLPQLIQLLKR